ncbi:MAG: flavodoxin [Promethearchaeota archaeon Loki_b31]|nr:MAG: flavodoxin [Candidatus Lokiarchaeota archaeon Loki_b31]
MKAIILIGSKTDDSESAKIHEMMLEELKKLNWDATSIILEDKNIAYCTGCFGCWVQTPGECVIKDYEETIVRKMVHSDLIIYITPIVFGGYSSILKKALDRQISRVLPYFTKIDGEVHHKKRYEKEQSLLGIGILDNPDAEKEEVFKTLVARNSINMWSPYQRAMIYTRGQDSLDFVNNFNNALREVKAIL